MSRSVGRSVGRSFSPSIGPSVRRSLGRRKHDGVAHGREPVRRGGVPDQEPGRRRQGLELVVVPIGRGQGGGGAPGENQPVTPTHVRYVFHARTVCKYVLVGQVDDDLQQ